MSRPGAIDKLGRQASPRPGSAFNVMIQFARPKPRLGHADIFAWE